MTILRGRLFAWLLLRLKQPQQTWCLVPSKTQFNFGGARANSLFAREFGEAAPACLLKFCVYVHSAIHLHCAREQCNSLALFTRTVQLNCTVDANSASELHCSREQCNSLALVEWTVFFFFSSVFSFCIYFF